MLILAEDVLTLSHVRNHCYRCFSSRISEDQVISLAFPPPIRRGTNETAKLGVFAWFPGVMQTLYCMLCATTGSCQLQSSVLLTTIAIGFGRMEEWYARCSWYCTLFTQRLTCFDVITDPKAVGLSCSQQKPARIAGNRPTH